MWFVVFSRHSLYFWAFVFNCPIVSHCTKFVFEKLYELEVIYIIIVFALKEGRFSFPKTIEEEELCVERAVPKSTRYKNKWAVGIFEDWQWVRSVKFPIVEIGGVFKEYELDKVQLLTRPVTEMDALTLNCLLSKFCSRGAYSWWKRTQPSSSIPWTLQTKDLPSSDEYWTQTWRMGLELALVWKQNKKKKSQSVCNLKCLSWPLFIQN